MTQLTRLLESSDDELELALLRSAREDAPSEVGLQDTALALGLTAATAKALAETLATSHAVGHAAVTTQAASATGALTGTGASAAVSIGSTSVATLAKFLAAGALVSFGAMTTIDRAISPRANAVPSKSAARAVEPRSLSASPVGAVAEAEVSVPLEAIHDPLVEADSRKPVSLRRAPAPAPMGAVPAPAPEARTESSTAPSVVSSATPPSNASLAAEIRWLDRTRAALAANDAAAARRSLRGYDEGRPSPVLRHEADLLRVRLLLAEGNRRAAAALARQIIAQHPESHHGDSLRSLAAEP